MTDITRLTSSAAKEALGLYFEPLQSMFRWFRGTDRRNDRGAVVSVEHRPLLIDEVRDEHFMDEDFRHLPLGEVLGRLKSQTVFVTCASHPAASRMATLLLGHASKICLVDSERRRTDVVKRWTKLLPSGSTLRLTYRFGNLADEDWLCMALESERPDVVFDFTTHAYLRARVPGETGVHHGLVKRYQYVYDKAEMISNIIQCSSTVGTVRAVLLVLPRFAENESVDHFGRLYSVVLREHATAVGVHASPEEPSISVWEPKHPVLSVRRLQLLTHDPAKEPAN